VTPRVVIVSAPSGAGKTTITRKLVELHPAKFDLSISATTRKPRLEEKDGQAYHFLSRDEFERWAREGRFLETAQYAGEWYGTPKSEVDRILASGKHAVLDIEVVGAEKIRQSWRGEAPITVFVLPASPQVLIERLRRRRSESFDQLYARLERAQDELRQSDTYDRLLRNDDLDEAVAALADIVEEGGGRRRDAAEAIRWINQFATDLQQEKVRFYNQMKGRT
jgi:guanylate kinase